MRDLIFVTSAFPYFPGEQFIEAEIEYLADTFDRIFIVPMYPFVTGETPRPVPPNVIVVPPVAGKGTPDGKPSLKALRVAQGLKFGATHPSALMGSVISSLRHFPKLKYLAEEFALDFIAKWTATAAVRTIRKFIGNNDSVVLYSYWMRTDIRVADYIRKGLNKDNARIVSRVHNVFTEHNHIMFLFPNSPYMNAAYRIYSVSDTGADYLSKRFPNERDKIGVRHLGVSAAKNPENANRNALHVLSCSFLEPLKRIPLLIDALEIMQQRGLPVKWTHIGGGDADYLKEISELSNTTLTPGSWQLMGTLTNSEVRQWLAENPVSVFANVSSTEGVPVSIMEALAQGIPVIATDVGGSSETINPEAGMFPGLLPENPTSTEIANAMETLLTSSDSEYRSYVDANIREWDVNWSSERNYSAFASELNQLTT